MNRAPHAKYIRRYKHWQEDVVLTSPFVIFCGIIACVFFFYRFLLVAAPIALLGKDISPQAGAGEGIVCSEEEGSHLADPKPLLSSSYQRRIQEQAALSANLVANPGLTNINLANNQPVGYTHTVERRGVTYSRGQDDSLLYLRTAATTATPVGSVPPAWLQAPVAIQPEHTYAYSFTYRSNTPVNVSAEYTTNGRPSYRDIMTLKPSVSWQQFTAHFTNFPAATSFRADISSSAKGYVDVRALDIHEIASAELDKGIVSVVFDDGWQSIADKAMPLLDRYGIRTTQYIISDVAAHQVAGYMTDATIQKLRQKGNEIGSHTLRHCDQTRLNANAIVGDAIESKQMLEKEKLGPITSFAYPLGQYNEKTQSVYEKNFQFIRSSDFGYNDRYFDETNIHSIGIVNTTTEKEFQSWLDYAKTHKAWVVLVYHKIDGSGTYNTTSAQLEQQLQLIRRSGLEVKPLSEAALSIR